jgi:hypothetical protein
VLGDAEGTSDGVAVSEDDGFECDPGTIKM